MLTLSEVMASRGRLDLLVDIDRFRYVFEIKKVDAAADTAAGVAAKLNEAMEQAQKYQCYAGDARSLVHVGVVFRDRRTHAMERGVGTGEDRHADGPAQRAGSADRAAA